MPERWGTGGLPPKIEGDTALAWKVANRKARRAPQKAALPKLVDRRAGKAEHGTPMQASLSMKGLTFDVSGTQRRR